MLSVLGVGGMMSGVWLLIRARVGIAARLAGVVLLKLVQW